MSTSGSAIEDFTRVTRGVIGDENVRLNPRRFSSTQKNESPGTSDNPFKNFDSQKRRTDSSSTSQRMLVRSPRSLMYDSGDNNSVTSDESKQMVALTSDRAFPPQPQPPPLPTTTPNNQNRSSKLSMRDHYSRSLSSASVATTVTPSTTTSSSTTGSAAFISRQNRKSRSFSTFFSHPDNNNVGLNSSINGEGIGWGTDSDDEGSQTSISIKAPLISKLLRNEMERRDGSDDEWDNAEKINSSYSCKFACSWSMCACAWIFLFALAMSIDSDTHYDDSENRESGELRWVNWDQIRYASSIFWTVGGDDYPGKDGLHISSYHRIITCIFMTSSLGFIGLALGQWGDAMIRAYDAAIIRNGGYTKKNFYAKKSYQIERGRQISRHRRQKPIDSSDQERKRYRTRNITVTEGNDTNYGSMSVSNSRYKRYQWQDLSPLKFPDSSDDEIDHRMHWKYPRADDDGADDCLILFPRIHWLILQSVLLTVLSGMCVTSIRYFEHNHSPHDIFEGIDINESAFGSEVSLEDEWDVLSTVYYAVSTATTSGVKNTIEPVSANGKILALLFVPLSVITSLHWMIYIAQHRIQKSQQQVRYEFQKRRIKEGDRNITDDERSFFDRNKSRESFFFANDGRNGVASEDEDEDEDDDHNDDAKTPLSSTSGKVGSTSSLEKFYEQELQRMGLVDIETFRVLKRKYALQQRVKLKETEV